MKLKPCPDAERIAQALRARFESGFRRTPWGDSILSGYEWVCLVREQTGLTTWAEAEALAFRVAPEFTMEYWEAWIERSNDQNPASQFCPPGGQN